MNTIKKNAKSTYDKVLNKSKIYFSKKNIKNLIFGSSTTRKMFRIYFLLLLLFSILLYLPISFKPWEIEGYGGLSNFRYENNAYIFLLDGEQFKFDFLDCLFTALSAFSDTGLTLGSTNSVFSIFGKVIIMFLIQIGGFGVMFIIFLFWKMINRTDKLTINQTLLAQSEKGNTKIGDTPKMLITTSAWIICIEIIFALFYSLWFLFVPAYEQIHEAGNNFSQDSDVLVHVYNNAGESFFAGFFHSISSVNNAGFDILGNSSLASYRNGIHSVFLYVTILQFIIGGIGFPVLYDILCKFKIVKIKKWNNKNKKYHVFSIKSNFQHRVSLLTKIAFVSYFLIAIISILIAILFEAPIVNTNGNLLWSDDKGSFGTGDISYFNKINQIIFQTFSARSAGFSTVDVNNLNTPTKWLITALMFIGGSPSSTAGGIRTTTFAICLVSIWSKLRGKNNAFMFKKTISKDNINDSFIISFVAMTMIAIGGIIVLFSLSKNSGGDLFSNAVFLSSSAFGTTGLSTINVADTHWLSKVYLMVLMFIGQYGISSTLLALNKRKVKTNTFKYQTEKVKIG